ncbi:glycosyltransferase [Nocardia sp. NPDC055321]
MRVLLAFAGSRGDAQPGVLLGRELVARGHTVTLAVSPNLVEFAGRHGITAVGFGLDSAELLRVQHSDRRSSGWNPVGRFRALMDLQRRGFAEAAGDLLPLASRSDLLVTGMACEEIAAEVARRHGIPLAAMHFFPIQPNRAVPVLPTALGASLPGAINRAGWRTLTALRARALAPEVAAVRSPGAVRPLVRNSIQAYDAELFPGLRIELDGAAFTGFPVIPGRPLGSGVPGPPALDAVDGGSGVAASALDPTPGSVHPVSVGSGARGLHDGTSPGEILLARNRFGTAPARSVSGLDAWLTADTPPVYVGFGSMPVGDHRDLELLVRTACKRQGRRLLLSGAAFRPGITADVAVVDQVDHSAVLPRCAVAVHHGGAGTTAAALRAGVPQVICAVQADQPFWGRQLETLGLGVTMPFTALSADRLERLLVRAAEPGTVSRAAAYAARFRDDGVARAADVIESLASPSLLAARPDAAGAPIRIGGAS